jgi:hypothetical protein
MRRVFLLDALDMQSVDVVASSRVFVFFVVVFGLFVVVDGRAVVMVRAMSLAWCMGMTRTGQAS